MSPFLFTIVMTTLLQDAHAKLLERLPDAPAAHFVRELVYADDTLLLDANPDVVQELMSCVEECGKQYGLSLNWSKVEMMRVRSNAHVVNSVGEIVREKEALVYLGTQLSSDGRCGSELSRRIGAAKQDFKVLDSIWSHATLSRHRKVKIFKACVVSKLCYCIFAACLNKSERKRLDGFQARCLRKIYRIQPSYYSRVSNSAVLSIAGERPLSEAIAKQQMVFLGKLARRPGNDPVRSSVLQPGGIELQTPTGTRKRGRPDRCGATWC